MFKMKKLLALLAALAPMVALGAGSAAASEIDLKIPSLDVAFDIFGMSVSGVQILAFGLIICVLGMALGWYVFH